MAPPDISSTHKALSQVIAKVYFAPEDIKWGLLLILAAAFLYLNGTRSLEEFTSIVRSIGEQQVAMTTTRSREFVQ
jgi:hypothetical protein